MFSFYLTNYSVFSQKAKLYASRFKACAILDSCTLMPPLDKGFYKLIIGLGNGDFIQPENNKLDFLFTTWNHTKTWMFGVLGYNLKNEIEKLSSLNKKCLGWPELLFFIPDLVITVSWSDELIIYGKNPERVYDLIVKTDLATLSEIGLKNNGYIKSDFDDITHCNTVNAVKEEIMNGNVYEMNLCSRFLYDNISIENPYSLYDELLKISPSPFSAFFSLGNKYVISASPERYLAKNKKNLLSQPMKGTRPRGDDKDEDEVLKTDLTNSIKDKAENVMIVDLVRNDLARVSLPGTVTVDELFGVYSFSHVHQMISTVSSEMEENYTWKDAIKATFPMGSMTGAPKIAAMKWIEKFEISDRELYSGGLGYIDPNGNFDFNVLIRSIFYDFNSSKLAYYAGGAITIDSDPEDEFTELTVKASAIDSLLKKYI